MSVQVWDSDDDGFLGRLLYQPQVSAELSLSEAGRFTVSAPYDAWRELMTVPPGFQHVRVYGGPDGSEIFHGIWLTRDDSPHAADEMTMEGADLLEELRWPCLPTDFYISNYPATQAIYWLLEQSGTDWELGDITRANEASVSVNIGGESYLEAILEIAQTSGNYVRHDGVSRVLDVFAEPFTVRAYVRPIWADDEDLPVPGGRIIPPISLSMDTGEVLRAVYPEGGSIIDQDGNEDTLRPTGNEDLPSGFSFERLRGRIAVANNAVTSGLIRPAEYSLIEPLSNRVVSASGAIESSGPGSITCEALRRPNDNFWAGGTLTIGSEDYQITVSNEATIMGNWSATYPEGDTFSVKRSFDYDAAAENTARQDLVDAACGLLRARARASQELNVTVEGLGIQLYPGDKVRLEWVSVSQTKSLTTDEWESHILTEFYGDLIVSSVETNVRDRTYHTLGLVRDLSLLPTDTGLREMRNIITATRRHADNRIMGVVSTTEPLLTWPGMLWMDTGS